MNISIEFKPVKDFDLSLVLDKGKVFDLRAHIYDPVRKQIHDGYIGYGINDTSKIMFYYYGNFCITKELSEDDLIAVNIF